MPFVEANGERIHYLVEGSGPAVMLLHSMGANAYMWRDQVAALKDRYTCIMPESRGHGETSYRTGFSVTGVAADNKAVLDDMGIAACHVVGLALGGPIALTFAAHYPDAVRSLVIADSFVDMREVGGARIPEWAKSIAATPMEKFGRRYADSRLMPSAAPGARDDMAAAIAKVPPTAYVDTMKAIFEIEFTAELASVRAPCLVIFGDQDDVTPIKHSRQIADGIPGARLEVIEDAGHIANIDQPEAFNRLLADFLDAQPN